MTQDKEDAMKRLTTRVIVLCAACALCLTAYSQPFEVDPEEYLKPPELRDVMWQILPEKVRDATVGPDGRVWWEFRAPPGTIRYEDIREVIEEQFRSESPVILSAPPVLFEPGGRVWFSFYYGYYLCGYDGERWIEHMEKKYPRSWGVCPSHGRKGSGCNYIIQEKAFFPGARGVHSFDPETETWSYHPIVEKAQGRTHLLPEPDGAGILAYYGRRRQCPLIWRRRDGRWTQLRLPPDLDSERIAGIAAAENGIWVDEQDTHSTRYRAKKLGVTPRTGLRFIPFDPEGFEEEQDVDEHFAAGPYTVKGVMLDFYDTFDTTYVRAKEILKEGKSLGPGMLIRRREGGVHALLGARFAEPWEKRRYFSDPDCGPILVPQKEAVWCPGIKGGEPAQLYSLKDGRLLATMRDQNFRWLHAVLPDGTVIARHPAKTSEYSMVAFKPGAEDDRNLLRCKRIEIKQGVFCVAADGTVWAEATASPEEQEGGKAFIARFDGRQWKPAEPIGDIRNVKSFLPGQNGELLVKANRRFFFVIGDKLYTDQDLEALIAAHRKEFAAAYFMSAHLLQGSLFTYYNRSFSVVADREGNIWLHRRNPSSLKVLTGDTWLDAEAPLRKMGSPDTKLKLIAGIGDGRMVYLTDFRSARENGVSCYGEVSDGEIVLAPAPCCEDSGKGSPRVRDHDNALWIMLRQPAGQRHGRPVYRKTLFRLFGDREQEVPLRTGYPVLCDKNGSVWLWTGVSTDRGTFDIWAQGKLPQAVTIPGMRHHLLSDHPGSVFAWSTTGIYHLTAEDPNDPAKYTVKTVYPIDGLKGEIQRVEHSSLGYMVVSTRENETDDQGGLRARYFLSLIKLPQPEEE